MKLLVTQGIFQRYCKVKFPDFKNNKSEKDTLETDNFA